MSATLYLGTLLILIAGCQRRAADPPLVEFRAGAPVPGWPASDGGVPDGAQALLDGALHDGAQAEPDPLPPDDGSQLDQLTVRYRTWPQSGQFAPRNVGAAWIERDDGTWIKTLEVWAALRARYLIRFNAASGGNRIDAISRATLRDHELHTDAWDLRDVHGRAVADGSYRVVIEVTDGNRAGAALELPFTLGPDSAGIWPSADSMHFSDVELSLR